VSLLANARLEWLWTDFRSGFTLVEQIGGGGFSRFVLNILCCLHAADVSIHYRRVYRATNYDVQRVAAVKLVLLTEQTKDAERQTLEREMRIHQALKHTNVIEFMDAVIVDNRSPQKSPYLPGVYMLLELAGAGDLFDKIAPDVGIESDMAHFYFCQLCAGVVCSAYLSSWANRSLIPH
jgi:serine/threonine-protein kinase CHEK1